VSSGSRLAGHNPTPSGAGSTTDGAPAQSDIGGLFEVDLSTWQIWWEYNQDAFVPLREAVLRPEPRTGDDELFLGEAQAPQLPAPREVGPELTHERIVPALIELLRTASTTDVTASAMLALGRIGEDPRQAGSHAVQDAIAAQLGHPNIEVAEFATIALGALASESAAPLLVEIASDTRAGRALTGRDSVSPRQRAFAAYGLALTGHLSPSADVRRYAVHHLNKILASERTSTHDLEVACTVGLGLLAVEGPRAALEADALPPSASREALVVELLDLFEDKSEERLLRAHVPTAIARLIEGEDGPLKRTVAERLLTGIAKRSGDKKREVRQGCVVALGLIGDSDGDPLDEDIRASLLRAAEDGDVLSRRYAIIALAQVASRPGRGAGDPLAGAADVKQFLFKGLERGASNLRPWHALAIGILGRNLQAQGRPLKPEEAAALRKELVDCRSAEYAGAYSLASAILKDRMSTDAVLEQFERFQDDAVRGHCALALGVLGADRSVERLRAVLRESLHRPEVLRQAATALALMGDRSLVADLVGLLATDDCQLALSSAATALGMCGDRQAVEPLLGLLDAKHTSGVRATAALALGRLADRELLPWSSVFSRASNYGAGPQSLADPGRFGIADLR
jgi:HEAT repeat protein